MVSRFFILSLLLILMDQALAKGGSPSQKGALFIKAVNKSLEDPSQLIPRPSLSCPNPPQSPADCFQLSHEEITNRCLAGRKSEAFIEIDRIDTYPCLSFAGITLKQIEHLIHYEIGIVDGKITARLLLLFKGLEKFSSEEKEKIKIKMANALSEAQALYLLHGLSLDLNVSYSDEMTEDATSHPIEIKLNQGAGTTSQAHWYLDLSNGAPGEWGPIPNLGLNGSNFPSLIAHELAHFLGLTDEYIERACGPLKKRNEERIQNGLLYTDCTWGAKCINLMIDNTQNSKNMQSFAQDAYAEILSPLCPNVCKSDYKTPVQ